MGTKVGDLVSCCRVLSGREGRWSAGPPSPYWKLTPPPAFSVCLDKETPAYLSLAWTGLLVCRGVEGADNSEEALHWASRGDRGRVLCPLGPSLQDPGSGDSAGKERGEAEPGTGLLSGLALSHSAFPTVFQNPPLPWALPTPGPLTCRCQGSCWSQVPRQWIPVPSVLCRNLVAQLSG